MEEIQEKAEEEKEKEKEEEKKQAERKKDQLELEKQIEKTKQNAEQIASSEPQEETVPSSPVVVRDVDVSDAQDIVAKNSGSDAAQTKIDRELAKILDELKLLTEDLKGSNVDMGV